MVRRSYSGNAPATTLNGGISSATLSIVVTSGTGYPAGGGAGPFFIVIDRGLSGEEKILCDSISGATITVNAAGRGADGTTAASHSSGAVVEHCYTKTDADEANAHVNDSTTDVHPQYTTAAELATAITAGLATVVAGARQRSITFAVAGEVFVPSTDTDYICPVFIPVGSGQTVKLLAARHRINGGTSATVKLQKNAVDITGFTGLSVTTTSTLTDPADVTLANGDLIALIVTAVSGSPKNMSFSLILEDS